MPAQGENPGNAKRPTRPGALKGRPPYFPAAFNPTTPSTINATHAIRYAVAGSFSQTIPTTNVPAAPIPVQAA
jgi:hypothetical protein